MAFTRPEHESTFQLSRIYPACRDLLQTPSFRGSRFTGKYHHAGHTRKASRISKAAVDNCGKGVGNFELS